MDRLLWLGASLVALKTFGFVSQDTKLSVSMPKWSNRSGGASPSTTQHLESMDRMKWSDQIASPNRVVCITDAVFAAHYNGVNPAP